MSAAAGLPFILHHTRADLKALLLDSTSTHYQVLGVSPGATDAGTLKVARRKLMLHLHPDRNVSPNGTPIEDRRIHDFAARVNVAHSVLSNTGERRTYDALLRSTHQPCAECAGAGFKVKQRGFKAQDRYRCAACGGGGWVLKGVKK